MPEEKVVNFSFVPFTSSNALLRHAELLSSQARSPDTIPNTYRPVNESAGFLKEELSTEMLNQVRRHLWIAGLPSSTTRPLHRHRVLNREIVVCEQVGLHLVSFRNRIYVKPIPRCLLYHDFYNDHIAPNQHLSPQALGFLSSYLRLIRYESDFQIANELGLLPKTVSWEDWLSFAKDIDKNTPRTFGNRFDYGELRLSRLNIIVRLQRGRFTRGYQSLDSSYGSYFAPFFAFLILAIGFIGLALSAFQVMQNTPNAPNAIFTAGWGFSIATLLLLGVVVCIPGVWLFILILDNAVFALQKRLSGH